MRRNRRKRRRTSRYSFSALDAIVIIIVITSMSLNWTDLQSERRVPGVTSMADRVSSFDATNEYEVVKNKLTIKVKKKCTEK